MMGEVVVYRDVAGCALRDTAYFHAPSHIAERCQRSGGLVRCNADMVCRNDGSQGIHLVVLP